MALKIEITACSWLVHGFLTKVGFIVNKRSEMLSLLWSVNLFIQVCKLIFIKLSWKDLIPTKFRSIVQRALLSTKNLDGCSECRLRFQISVSKENTICEKNKEALRNDIIFFSHSIISSTGLLLATAIIRWPPRKVTALQVVRFPGFVNFTFFFLFPYFKQ